MTIDFTNRELRVSAFGILFALFVGIVLLTLSGCSSTYEQKPFNDQQSFTGEKSFSFKDNGSTWRVDFKDDEINSLYKDGNRVPDSEVDQHKEMIYKNLRQLHSKYNNLSQNFHQFHFDTDKFEKDMEKFKDDFDNDKYFHFKLEFDEDEFEKNMEELEERLKDLKDKKIELYFDSEEFQDQMKELEENLKDMPLPPNPPDVDIDVYLDMDDLKDGMKKFGESFKHFDFKFDSSDFDMHELKENMIELKKNMKGLKIELHGLNGEMRKLDSFLEELKLELVKDGYLTSSEYEYDLEMHKGSTNVNDKPVKFEDHKKYLELYKRHFDKEIEGTIKINRD